MKTEEQKAWWFRFFLLLFVLDPQWSWWSHDSESETPPGVPRRNLAPCLQPASKVVSDGGGFGGGVGEEGGALWLLQSRNVFILGVQTVELFCRKMTLMGFYFLRMGSIEEVKGEGSRTGSDDGSLALSRVPSVVELLLFLFFFHI